MKPLRRVALIGNHLPRRCGIATFTHDLHRAISTARPDLEACVVAMNDPGATYDYPAAVRFQIQWAPSPTMMSSRASDAPSARR